MSTLKANRVEQVSNSNLPVNLLPVTAAAWVRFDGTGVPTIRDSHNVESITDNGTGNYTINFEVALGNGNFSAIIATEGTAPSNSLTNPSTNSLQCRCYDSANNAIDRNDVSVAVFGGQS